MGWGKSSKSSSPPPPPPQQQSGPDTAQITAMIEKMFGTMMEGQMAMMQQMQNTAPQMPNLPAMPEIRSAPSIDWAEKQDQLASKQKASYHLDKARRKGSQDTVLTSPLLDDEDPEVTGSVLAGKS